MSLNAVLKIGGSLSRGTDLPDLCSEISRLAKHQSLLVVPGGGDFAEQVRAADRRFHLNGRAAHCMALLGMDQYGYLLNQLIANSCLTDDLNQACASAECGRAAVLLPSAIVMREDPLPHSWQVTSDSIAAWISDRAGCRRLVLIKDVDGLMTRGRLIEKMPAEQLRGHTGGVDEYLWKVLSSSPVETWIISGSHPGRLPELLTSGCTVGTLIPRISHQEHQEPEWKPII